MPSQTESFSSIQTAAAAELVLLLKFTRLYGPRHARTVAQLDNCWQKLEPAVREDAAGLTLTVTRSELLVHGSTLEMGSAAEQNLRQTLAKAGIAGVVFLPEISQASLREFIRAYSEAALRPALLKRRLDSLFRGHPHSGIRIEMREAAAANHKQPAAEQMLKPGLPPDNLRKKILRLISEAEKSARNSYEFGEEFVGFMHLPAAKSLAALDEEDVRALVRMLAKSAQAVAGDLPAAREWKNEFTGISAGTRSALREMISELKEFATAENEVATMISVAEDAAVRYAVERFDQGELKAAKVDQLLARLGNEISQSATPKTQQKANGEGRNSHTSPDAAGRQARFWSSVSASSLHSVLCSVENPCVPASFVRRRVEEFLQIGEEDVARKILSQYARSAAHSDPRIREKAAAGFAEMADLYLRAGEIDFALHVVGAQMAVETEPELQKRLGAAFVRFSQAAAERRSFGAVNEALDRLASIEREKPESAASLRPRAGIINRIPEFIEEGVKQPGIREELADALRKMPQASADYLSSGLMRVASGTEREQIVRLARTIGQPGCEHLRQTFQSSPLVSGSRALGLLSRLDAPFVERLLPEKMLPRDTAGHDAALHQLSTAGAPERGRLLMRAIDGFDLRIAPLVLDEIGMCGDASVTPELLRLAQGELIPNGSDFLRVKAIEAIGRLRAPEAVPQLLQFIEARRALRWMHPREMRIAAAQALVKIQPEYHAILESAGIDARQMGLAPLDARTDRDFVRHRRYRRIYIAEPIPAVIQSKENKLRPFVNVLSLDGGLLKGDLPIAAGTCAGLRISSGLRPIRMEVMVRFARGNQAGIEMTGMTLADRSRLRSLLVSVSAPPVQSALPPA